MPPMVMANSSLVDTGQPASVTVFVSSASTQDLSLQSGICSERSHYPAQCTRKIGVAEARCDVYLLQCMMHAGTCSRSKL